jgi:hypothetical protein
MGFSVATTTNAVTSIDVMLILDLAALRQFLVLNFSNKVIICLTIQYLVLFYPLPSRDGLEESTAKEPIPYTSIQTVCKKSINEIRIHKAAQV